MTLQQYVCSEFSERTKGCQFQCEGPRNEVEQAATDHLVEEHNYDDSPELEKRINEVIHDYP